MTTREIFHDLIEFPWIVFVIYWVIGAIKTRATREKESLASRFAILVLEVVGYVLIFNGSTGFGFLGTRFMPRTMAIMILGVVCTWSGIGLTIWARYHLAELEREDHNQRRPSAHPYRTLHSLATPHLFRPRSRHHWFSFGDRRVRCVLGICLVLTGYCLKAKKEEAMLGRQFGDAFREHQKHTGFLIPRFR